MATAFKLEEITRHRTVGWGILKAGEKPQAITTAHLSDDDGNILTGDALAAKIKSFPKVVSPVDTKNLTPITVADLPKEYAQDAKSALAKLAAEWSDGAKDENGKPVKWTPDDVAHYLVLQSRMQDAANASIKVHRPVSDKALDRGVTTMVKGMKANGKTLAEIVAVFAATGMNVPEADIREAFGA